MDDKRIMELLARRDEAAIGECSAAYGGLLYRVAFNILGSHADAEECVQDALHKLWRSAPGGSIVSLRAYLVAIVRNIALIRLREGAAQKRGGGEYTAALSELENCIPARDGVEELAEEHELAAAIGRWLQSLRAEDRVLFVRRYRLGDPIPLLARELGLPPKRVTKRLYDLREKLRKYLVKEHFLK